MLTVKAVVPEQVLPDVVGLYGMTNKFPLEISGREYPARSLTFKTFAGAVDLRDNCYYGSFQFLTRDAASDAEAGEAGEDSFDLLVELLDTELEL